MERKPLASVLDDLHWSDPASIELLAALLRRGMYARTAGARVPSGKAPAKLILALAGATIIDLGPLSETEPLDWSAPTTMPGDVRRERRQPVLHAPAGRNRRTAVAQFEGDRLARDVGFPAWSRPRSSSSSVANGTHAACERGRDRRRSVRARARVRDRRVSPDAGVVALDELLDARLLQPTDVPRRCLPAPARAPRGLRDHQGRLAAGGHAAPPRRWRRRAAAAARAHHVEQSGVAATARRSTCCSKRATRSPRRRRPARPTGTRRRCG